MEATFDSFPHFGEANISFWGDTSETLTLKEFADFQSTTGLEFHRRIIGAVPFLFWRSPRSRKGNFGSGAGDPDGAAFILKETGIL
jgi:hypothetical protein